jgi:hypothetical protein
MERLEAPLLGSGETSPYLVSPRTTTSTYCSWEPDTSSLLSLSHCGHLSAVSSTGLSTEFIKSTVLRKRLRVTSPGLSYPDLESKGAQIRDILRVGR